MPPAEGDVPVEAHRLVLREHQDPAHAAVEAVREREVDDPVDAAERHGRLGPVARQRLQPRALAACQHDRQNILHRCSRPPWCRHLRRGVPTMPLVATTAGNSPRHSSQQKAGANMNAVRRETRVHASMIDSQSSPYDKIRMQWSRRLAATNREGQMLIRAVYVAAAVLALAHITYGQHVDLTTPRGEAEYLVTRNHGPAYTEHSACQSNPGRPDCDSSRLSAIRVDPRSPRLAAR